MEDAIRFIETCSLANIIVAGDLNIVLALNEKKGGLRGKDFMQDIVENLIHDWKLIDLKPKQGRYTWSNNRVGSSCISARLDRFLVHSPLFDVNLIISTKNLPKLSSDHHPILLQIEKEVGSGPSHSDSVLSGSRELVFWTLSLRLGLNLLLAPPVLFGSRN